MLNQIRDNGGLALAGSPNLGRLETLDLAYTGVGDGSLEAMAASLHLSQLSTVDAWGTRLTREGTRHAQALAEERWRHARESVEPVVHFWMHTDYDERIITYGDGTNPPQALQRSILFPVTGMLFWKWPSLRL